MGVFSHLLYEYKKGLRNLSLYTFHPILKDGIEKKLRNMGVDYIFQQVSDEKLNVFFGDSACVEIVKTLGNKPLCKYTAEEDFMLGVMLGYNRLDQCVRYLKFQNTSNDKKNSSEMEANLYPISNEILAE